VLLWKSGHSGPRKSNESSLGFSPGGRFALANSLFRRLKPCTFNVAFCNFQLMSEPNLLEQFVATFEKFDEMTCPSRELDPVSWELRIGEPDQHGWIEWRPARVATDRKLLDPLYAKLPARFPPLFEQLVLSYRWAEVDLGSFRLLANPPGTDLGGLLAEIERDKALTESLVPAGYVKFGKGPDMDYDPVCFDIKSRTKSKDYRIVKIDHEQILCNSRVKVVAELAPSFRQLMIQTIEQARSLQ
jgi:hypothetical protein